MLNINYSIILLWHRQNVFLFSAILDIVSMATTLYTEQTQILKDGGHSFNYRRARETEQKQKSNKKN